MRRLNVYVFSVIVTAALVASGCAQLKEKFVRKPKEDAFQGRHYYAVRQYDVRPNLELYTKRYVYWKNWHRELLAVLGHSNHKKAEVAVEQEISNMLDMQSMLDDEKAEELQGLIEQMTEVEQQIKKSQVSTANEVRLRKKIEAVGGKVKRNFSYTKIGDHLADEFRSEPKTEN